MNEQWQSEQFQNLQSLQIKFKILPTKEEEGIIQGIFVILKNTCLPLCVCGTSKIASRVGLNVCLVFFCEIFETILSLCILWLKCVSVRACVCLCVWVSFKCLGNVKPFLFPVYLCLVKVICKSFKLNAFVCVCVCFHCKLRDGGRTHRPAQVLVLVVGMWRHFIVRF